MLVGFDVGLEVGLDVGFFAGLEVGFFAGFDVGSGVGPGFSSASAGGAIATRTARLAVAKNLESCT